MGFVNVNGGQSRLQRVEFAVLMAAVFFAPYNALHIPGLFFTLSDLFFSVAIVLRLLTGMALRPLEAATAPWLIGFVFLNFGLLISSLINGDPIKGAVVFVQYLFVYICLPYAVLSRPYDQTIVLIKCAVWSLLIMCVFGIVAFLWGYNGGTAIQFVIVTGGGRLVALVDNANGLAAVIAFTLPLIWFLAVIESMTWKVAIPATAVFCFALILTGSNTGMIGMIMAGLVFFLGVGRAKIVAVTSIGFGVIVSAILLWGTEILPAIFQKRVLGAILSGDASEAGTFQDRYRLMLEAWTLAENHLLIGLGIDQYRLASEHGAPVHNTYLLLLNEGGIVAVFGLVMIWGSSLIAPLSAINRPHRYPTLLCTLTVVVTLACLANAFTHMYARYLILPLLLAMGPALSIERHQNRQ